MKRYLVFAALSMAIAAIIIPHQARAADESRSFDILGFDINRGYTLQLPSPSIRLVVPPSVISDRVYVELKQFSDGSYPAPAGLKLASNYYLYDILRQPVNPATFQKPVEVAIATTSVNYFRKQVYFWANAQRGWVALPSHAEAGSSYIVATTHLPFSRLAVFENPAELEGIASYYQTSKYKLGAASNNYPLGTVVRVRNVENGKSVDVEIKSKGPFGKGRVIDLTKAAFNKIYESWHGLARVQVVPVNSKAAVLGVDTDHLPPPPPPVLKSAAAIAYNVQTGEVLFEKNAHQKLPIASLTKIVSAMVFLDTATPWDTVVTYSAADNAIGAKLQVAPGETLLVKDLYYTGLVGSANNAINALARSTGLSKQEFVARMNKKAADFGLTDTHFTDPTGLDPTNVSTAADYAKLAAAALKDFRILQGTTTAVYSFKTLNTGQPHVIKNKDKMLGTSWYVTGMKTGYLDEAQYCLMVKARQGKQGTTDVITVVLGSATDAGRYADTEKLLRSAFAVQ